MQERGARAARELCLNFTYVTSHLDVTVEISGIKPDQSCLKSNIDQINSV